MNDYKRNKSEIDVGKLSDLFPIQLCSLKFSNESGGGFFLLNLEMFRNFLKVALRNLARRKGYALLNVLGLALGITCCLVIFEYVAYERSYDRFEPNADRLYRVQDEDYQGGRMVLPCAAASPGVAAGMLREFPGSGECMPALPGKRHPRR